MRGLLLGSCLIVLVGAGCARKENTQNSSAQAPASSTESVPAAGGHESATEQVDASGSAADVVGRVHEQEQQLDRIIAAAQLNEVHRKAFAIRDLVEAAAAKASDSQKAELQPHVEAVRTIAGELDEAGDLGDLERTKSGYQKLQTHLRAIEGVLGAAAH